MSIEESNRRWEEETVDPVVERFPERKARFETTSDIPIQRLYVPPTDRDYEAELGFPARRDFAFGSTLVSELGSFSRFCVMRFAWCVFAGLGLF